MYTNGKVNGKTNRNGNTQSKYYVGISRKMKLKDKWNWRGKLNWSFHNNKCFLILGKTRSVFQRFNQVLFIESKSHINYRTIKISDNNNNL